MVIPRLSCCVLTCQFSIVVSVSLSWVAIVISKVPIEPVRYGICYWCIREMIGERKVIWGKVGEVWTVIIRRLSKIVCFTLWHASLLGMKSKNDKLSVAICQFVMLLALF